MIISHSTFTKFQDINSFVTWNKRPWQQTPLVKAHSPFQIKTFKWILKFTGVSLSYILLWILYNMTVILWIPIQYDCYLIIFLLSNSSEFWSVTSFIVNSFWRAYYTTVTRNGRRMKLIFPQSHHLLGSMKLTFRIGNIVFIWSLYCIFCEWCWILRNLTSLTKVD